MGKRTPNILLVWTDQQRNETLPCHGNDVVSWHNSELPDEEGRSLVTTDRWKLNLYHDDRPELFDLKNDPAELVNLADQAAHRSRIESMREGIFAWQERFDDGLSLNS